MPHLNQITIVGHLGKDPEQRTTQNGTAVANFSVAVSDREKVNGEWQDSTEWFRCVAFNNRAEYLCHYGKKGDLCIVTGKMKTRKWQDQQGNDRYTTELIADNAQPYPKADLRSQQSGQQSAGQNVHDDPLDSDIPF